MIPPVTLPAGYKLVAVKPYSDHPDDNFLWIVLAQGPEEYVTWLFNVQQNGCGNGRYFGEDEYTVALDDFNTRNHRK
jgi:hypothetical protein